MKQEDEEPTGKLLQAFESISPEQLKTTSHQKYAAQLLEITKQVLINNGTRLLVLIQSIKSSQPKSYKREILVEILQSLVSDDEFLNNHLILKPFGQACARVTSWQDLANALTSIPELIANCQLLETYPGLRRAAFHGRLLDSILSVMKNISQVDSQPLEHRAFLLQLLGRISMSDKEIVWTKFTSKIGSLISADDKFRSTFESVFQQPLRNDSSGGVFDAFVEHLHVPLFTFVRPSQNSGQKLKALLGQEAIENLEFQYIVCDRSILKTNFNIERLRQKAILTNTFSYLSCETSERNDLLIETFGNVLANWADPVKILLRLHEHSRYITWALLIGFRFAIMFRREKVKTLARDYQASIITAIPTYLSRSDASQRNLGICVAELILPELHKIISEDDPKAREIEIPKLADSKNQSSEYEEACELFKEEFDIIFKDSHELDGGVDSGIAPQNKPATQAKSKHRTKTEKPTKMVVDSDDEDDSASGDEDDEIFGQELARVPIYLRDCANGLIEQSSNARYTRLCLVRASELIDKLASEEQQEFDIIKDVGVELARAVLFMDNQFNLKDFDTYRMKILTSLCNAAPELVSQYMVEEFNGTSRSVRHQLEILQALVASAQKLSTKSPTSSQGKGKINGFARFVPLYFYGIINRLKADYMDQGSNMITPQPRSILTPFRELREGGLTLTSERSLGDIIMPQAIDVTTSEKKLTVASASSSTLASKKQKNDRVSEVELISDDSYLLSRILTSLSMIVECAEQQPALCKISSDFLNILKVYRCHPDLGVQKAMVSCLRSIQKSTPKVYFSQYIEEPMVKDFGAWLESKALTQ